MGSDGEIKRAEALITKWAEDVQRLRANRDQWRECAEHLAAALAAVREVASWGPDRTDAVDAALARFDALQEGS